MDIDKKTPAFIVCMGLLILGTLALFSVTKALLGTLYFIPFTMGPLIVSLLFSESSSNSWSQVILIISSILYAVWFGYVFMDVFHWNVDPQSGIALLFVGIYSLPLMVPVWIIVWLMNSFYTKQKK